MYEYYWGHTRAQLELMNVDGVYTCYKRDDDKPANGSKTPPSKEKMEEVARKWEANKEKRKMNLEKFLRGFSKEPTVKQD